MWEVVKVVWEVDGDVGSGDGVGGGWWYSRRWMGVWEVVNGVWEVVMV